LNPAKYALIKNVRTGGARRQKWGRKDNLTLDKLEYLFYVYCVKR
jgi:hypothetical protein